MTSSFSTTHASAAIFRVSPLIRFSLYGLLTALVLPLPFLMVHQHQTQLLPLAIAGIGLGFLALLGLMSQRVCVDAQGIRVEYAHWVPTFLVQGWTLPWTNVQTLDSRPTSQGGRAHYLLSSEGHAYLLPMRIAGFARFLKCLESYSKLDTSSIKPLAQPWMYLMLGVCVLVMLVLDIPIIVMALSISNQIG
jgi:hypothetical protein